MILGVANNAADLHPSPRTRGDDPLKLIAMAVSIPFSPHPRG